MNVKRGWQTTTRSHDLRLPARAIQQFRTGPTWYKRAPQLRGLQPRTTNLSHMPSCSGLGATGWGQETESGVGPKPGTPRD